MNNERYLVARNSRYGWLRAWEIENIIYATGQL